MAKAQRLPRWARRPGASWRSTWARGSASRAGDFIERRGFAVQEWSERHTVELARRYGYGGLALALSVLFFPDTLSIYAFSILERDYLQFALATFVGSVGRLLVTVFLVGGTLAVW